jgi:hypothetical protein
MSVVFVNNFTKVKIKASFAKRIFAKKFAISADTIVVWAVVPTLPLGRQGRLDIGYSLINFLTI